MTARGYLARQVLPQARGRLSSASPGTAVGAPVPPPRGSRPSAAHPPAPALGPHGEHHHQRRAALRVPPAPALLPGAASLEVTGSCPRRSPLPGEVILAAMCLKVRLRGHSAWSTRGGGAGAALRRVQMLDSSNHAIGARVVVPTRDSSIVPGSSGLQGCVLGDRNERARSSMGAARAASPLDSFEILDLRLHVVGGDVKADISPARGSVRPSVDSRCGRCQSGSAASEKSLPAILESR